MRKDFEIKICRGGVADLARKFKCSRTTVYKALKNEEPITLKIRKIRQEAQKEIYSA